MQIDGGLREFSNKYSKNKSQTDLLEDRDSGGLRVGGKVNCRCGWL